VGPGKVFSSFNSAPYEAQVALNDLYQWHPTGAVPRLMHMEYKAQKLAFGVVQVTFRRHPTKNKTAYGFDDQPEEDRSGCTLDENDYASLALGATTSVVATWYPGPRQAPPPCSVISTPPLPSFLDSADIFLAPHPGGGLALHEPAPRGQAEFEVEITAPVSQLLSLSSQVLARYQSAEGPVVGALGVNLYKEQVLESRYFHVWDPRLPSTKISIPVGSAELKSTINSYLASVVFRLDDLKGPTDLPVDFDLNGNGRLDDYLDEDKGGAELKLVYDAARTASPNPARTDDLLLVEHELLQAWRLRRAVGPGDRVLQVEGGSGHLRQTAKSDPEAELYVIGRPAPNGYWTDQEYFIITNRTGRVVEICKVPLQTGPAPAVCFQANPPGFTLSHPLHTDPKAAHAIFSLGRRSAGRELIDKEDGIPIEPALAAMPQSGSQSVRTTEVAGPATHELMHGRGLRHANKVSNVMHRDRATRKVDEKYALRYLPLIPYDSNDLPIPGERPDRQWVRVRRQ
jgi:hypothetical protein